MCQCDDIALRLGKIRQTLREGVELVAVSKFHPVASILEAYDAGQRIFAESRIQEFSAKVSELAHIPDIRWHFIGHIQTNKLKALMKCHPALIQSVDTERLLTMIDHLAAEVGITQRVLLQIHVAQEETKFGFSPSELEAYFAGRRFESLKATHICGIMGMATNTDDMERVTADFHLIKDVYDRIRANTPDLRGFDILSMGMTDDYITAMECGSDMVRIGSAIFGPRNY